MGKKAQEYLKSRAPKNLPHGQQPSGVDGIDNAQMEQNMRRQALSDLTARRTAAGLVPVAIDFANVAVKLGVSPTHTPEEEFGTDDSYWVPAWYLAAWYAFTGDADIMGSPTRGYETFIHKVMLDPREKMLLVGEATLSYPHHAKDTLNGIRAWLELNT